MCGQHDYRSERVYGEELAKLNRERAEDPLSGGPGDDFFAETPLYRDG